MRADDPSLKEMVLREYPPAIKVLQDRFSRARGIVRKSTQAIRKGESKGASRDQSVRLAFECRGPEMARVVARVPTKKNGDTEESEVEAGVSCCNREYSFSLTKQNAEAGYSVTRFETDAEGRLNMRDGVMEIELYRYLNASFTLFFGSPNITDGSLSVRTVSRVGDEREKTLRIEFDSKPTAKQVRELHGWFVVSPEQAWVLRSFEFSGQGGSLLPERSNMAESSAAFQSRSVSCIPSRAQPCGECSSTALRRSA